ncbi:SPOR domain-containing protein [Devosia sp. XJ19-1]|uniref:SPOR domain-containing protein n=1 Tax=Devosia ureilytica TaxID=2952754 RepID=A0A9Q4AL88_9HYPH|nr:SPOR domain-containing protein [Devosia ureilytica]MCP8882127.1 SPOR domain-containing protein [Devosia ureilytica]MCP8885987.1 SPOR domain-containing protein [Devosia ureilytica]
MAAQTEAPDDLIAELARLMADDARGSQPVDSEQSKPVRIPGEATAAPTPRYDFSVSADMAAGKGPSSPVRIPGGQAEPAASAEPFNFNFDLSSSTQKAAQTPSEPSPSATKPAAPPLPPSSYEMPSAPEQAAAPLDQDSLADLIAAELAADIGAAPVAFDPAPVTTRPTGPDNFAVPPVFGLGTAPQNPAPAAPVAARQPEAPSPAKVEAAPAQAEESPDGDALDPLDEIERLVGPAVRMNVAHASPTPALRSLATPTIPEPVSAAPELPQPSPQSAKVAPEPVASMSSVDEAILAAAAATGAHVEWVNAGDRDETSADDGDEAMVAPIPARNIRVNRAIAGPLVAVGLLAVAGFGLYWALGQGGDPAGPAPLLVADTTATKEIPEPDTAAATQSVVFNEISGAEPTAEEQIVSRDQADTEAVVAANSPVASSGVIADESGDTVDPNQDGLVNRKVRTVTVRPDGTIVSGEDSLAGSAILPVDRPNVPDVPGADFSTPDLIANASAEVEAAAAVAPAATVSTPAVVPAEPGAIISVVDATGAPITGRSVTMPMQRPADFSTIAASAIASANAAPATALPATAPSAVAPAPQQAAATANSAGSASAYVQLASQRSEDAARQSAQAIATRYGVLFGGASPEISRVDLGERGIYYRVVVPAPSRENAANICANVRAAGGDCLLL